MREDNRSTYNLGYSLSIFFILAFYVLDVVYYPERKGSLLAVRIAVAAYLVVARYLSLRVQQKYLFPISAVSIILSSAGCSLLCLFTGEGFATPYYTAVLMAIIVISVFFHFPPRQYVLYLVTMIVQHFIILSFGPFYFKGFVLQLMTIGGLSLASGLVHRLVYHLTEEIKTLQGFIPICAQCKKVRDVKGYWRQVEEYIRDNSEAEFTHSYCPECERELLREGGLL